MCNALVALRLSIRNTGKEDISKSSFADPIKFAFDDKYEILDVTKSQQYEKIRPFIQFTSSQIYISWSLLKHSNSFEIDIIAQKKSGVGMIDSAVDFYNGMSYDLNIVGVDELLIEKKITRAERILKKSRAKICFFAIYFVMFAFMAFASKNRPDNEYELILQNDTTLVETAVFVYAEDSVVKIEEFDKKMSIEDFNNEYQIRGVSHKIFDISLIFYVVYIVVAILSFLMVILWVINYIKKRAKLKEDLGSI